MPLIKIPPKWHISENTTTPEDVYLNRRKFIRNMGNLGINALALYMLPNFLALSKVFAAKQDYSERASKTENKLMSSMDRITAENLVSRYNNFYEFGTKKSNVWRLSQKLPLDDWAIKVEGLTNKTQVLDLEKMIKKMPLEQRIYRLRCVETWSAIIPWSGFPLRELLKILEPPSTARYIKFKTFIDPNIAPGQKDRFWEPWPYVESITIDEAKNALAMLAVGMHGEPLPPQNGAPLRLILPWKYGFKGIKSIVKISFVDEEPLNTWKRQTPREYGFYANVNPNVDHPRWTQARERRLGEVFKRDTLMFNGYGEHVGKMYEGMDLTHWY